MKTLTTFIVLLSCTMPIAIAQTHTSDTRISTRTASSPRGVQAELDIELVDCSNPEPMNFIANPDNTVTLSIAGSSIAPSGAHGSFAFGVFIDFGDIVVDCVVSKSGTGTVSLFDVDAGVLIPLTTGPYTLLMNQKYMFRGDAGSAGEYSLSMHWAEQYTVGDISSIAVNGHATFNVSDMFMSIRSADTGVASISFVGPMEMYMTPIANVTSTTLALPTNAEEGLVIIPAGMHTITLGPGFAWLLIDLAGDELLEDINLDGVVDVADLLMVIAAWGMTGP